MFFSSYFYSQMFSAVAIFVHFNWKQYLYRLICFIFVIVAYDVATRNEAREVHSLRAREKKMTNIPLNVASTKPRILFPPLFIFFEFSFPFFNSIWVSCQCWQNSCSKIFTQCVCELFMSASTGNLIHFSCRGIGYAIACHAYRKNRLLCNNNNNYEFI